MKILVFNWQDIRNPLAGGAEVHFHQIFSRIASRGHSVTLFCSRFPGAPAEETIDGIRIIREGGRGLFNYHVIWKYLVRFRREAYDVVIDDMNKIPFFTPLYVRRPLAIIIHHLFGRSIFLEASWPVAMYVHLTERFGLALARRFHTPVYVVSQSTKKEVLATGIREESLDIIYNCVDHRLHVRGTVPRSPAPLIGYFGRLKKYKSVEHLLHAFSRIRKEFPACRLVVIGDGDYRPTLERMAGDLGIADAVTFTGFVTEAEKVRLLQEMWFLVNTSSKEGWGLTVIEANACGTTVIASDVPGLRDAVRDGETGLLYTYGDVDELAGRIKTLLTDADRRRRLEEEAYRWAATFDWDDMAEKTIGLLRNLISSGSTR
jgi:glycosyltransferase involved in cell wall biosynthesis